MGNKIRIFSSADDLSQYFAKKLASYVKQIPPGQNFTLALSGGSSPRKVFEYLASHYCEQINWQNILVFWSDERCVGPRNEESNYRMAMESLLDHVPIPADNIFRIKGEADPKVETLRYADVVRQRVPSVNGVPQFDMIMLGLGEDGHTVSVFPDKLSLFNSENYFEVAEHPLTKQKRITATGKIINHSKTVIFLVTGELKADILAHVIEKKEGWENLPASFVNPVESELIWLLDEKAAGKLTQVVDPD